MQQIKEQAVIAAKERRAESKWKKIQRRIMKRIPLDEKPSAVSNEKMNLSGNLSLSEKSQKLKVPTLMVEEELIDLEDETFPIIKGSRELVKIIEEDEKSNETYIKGEYLT